MPWLIREGSFCNRWKQTQRSIARQSDKVRESGPLGSKQDVSISFLSSRLREPYQRGGRKIIKV